MRSHFWRENNAWSAGKRGRQGCGWFYLYTWLVGKGGANFLEQSEHIEAKVIRTRNTLQHLIEICSVVVYESVIFRTSHLVELCFSFCFLAATDVFKLSKVPKHKNKDLVISASYFEIYGSKVKLVTTCIVVVGERVIKLIY